MRLKMKMIAPRLADPPPKYLWRLMLGIGCGLVLLIPLSAIALGLGLADPPQAEQLLYDYRANQDPFNALDLSNPILTFPESIQAESFTIEMSARLHPESDFYAAWGVWLESAENYRLILINGTGYVTALSCPALEMALDDCALPPDAATQWRYFHFLRPLGEVNQIYLHYDPERPNLLSLRLNREWMWDVPYTLPPEGLRWGVWRDASAWSFERLRLWTN